MLDIYVLREWFLSGGIYTASLHWQLWFWRDIFLTDHCNQYDSDSTLVTLVPCLTSVVCAQGQLVLMHCWIPQVRRVFQAATSPSIVFKDGRNMQNPRGNVQYFGIGYGSRVVNLTVVMFMKKTRSQYHYAARCAKKINFTLRSRNQLNVALVALTCGKNLRR